MIERIHGFIFFSFKKELIIGGFKGNGHSDFSKFFLP